MACGRTACPGSRTSPIVNLQRWIIGVSRRGVPIVQPGGGKRWRRRNTRSTRRSVRPRLEPLEVRTAPATYLAASTGRDGNTGPPPTVTALQRFGFHARPMTLVLSFSAVLDGASARDLSHYALVAIAH